MNVTTPVEVKKPISDTLGISSPLPSTTYLLERCPPNPTLEYAESITIPQGTTEIISRGGGSTMDVGKFLARKYNLRHVAIPTTAGTGAEVTKYCVLTTNGVKTTYTDDRFIPDKYYLDPDLVVSLPYDQTLATGLDALSQSVESFWSKNATQESKAYSKVAIRLVEENLHSSLTFPWSKISRMNMLLAANMSGRAINITRTNVCHAISYPLTDLYKIPHGIACGMSLWYFTKDFLPDVSNFVKDMLPHYEIDPEKVANIAIQSPKLKDVDFEVTREDIITSLNY